MEEDNIPVHNKFASVYTMSRWFIRQVIVQPVLFSVKFKEANTMHSTLD